MRLRTVTTLLALAASALLYAEAEKYTAAERRHWAFQPRGNPEIPRFHAAADRAWVKNPIDAFILRRLQKDGLKPAPRAGRRTLIRRVWFDLTGLPPAPAEVDAFAKDPSPNAYEKLVDRLLASSQYGERWGQHWLDVVRFAETDGFEYDTHRPDAWRYRDYVIRSFNNDKPYDQFIREQLAGDEINPKHEELRIAAGLQRLGPLRKNAGNQEVASSRNEVLTEMTNVVGSAMLGVTLGCARCHDHKFDPIRHTDYYRMQAFFASTFDNDVPLASPAQQADWKAKNEAVQTEMKQIKAKMRKLKGEDLMTMQKQLEAAESKAPPPLPAIFSVAEDPEKATPIHVLARGDYANKGQRVAPRALGVLVADDTPELPADDKTPRTKLANWVTQPDHPLTARVMVNRVWNYHFGRGIVATPNDFGRMGARPTHPELLDYLANEFVNSGWRVKAVHRMILLSSAYRQASSLPVTPGSRKLLAAAKEKDPENKLLSLFPRRRLEAEELRDAMLAVGGKLNDKQGGPSVIVPVDKDLVNFLYKPSQWAVTPDENEHFRRSVYLLAKRNLRLPFMEVFDTPDLQLSCARRESSTHAPQALELLNGDLSNEMADALAERLAREAGPSKPKQIDLAFRLTTGRAPTLKERQFALEFLKTQPLREFALATLNLNNFLYVD